MDFYQTMMTRQVRGPEVIYFTIDGREGVLTAEDIARALQIPYTPVGDAPNAPRTKPSPSEMVRTLAGGDPTYPGYILRRELPPQMLLADHVLRSNVFPCQHTVQRRGIMLDALYRIHQGQWFSPADLIMAALIYFEDRVHVKKLQRAETYELYFPRLLSFILERLGFPSQPELERKHHCREIFLLEKWTRVYSSEAPSISVSTEHRYSPPAVVQRIYALHHPEEAHHSAPADAIDRPEHQTPPPVPASAVLRSPPPTAASSFPQAPVPDPSAASSSQAPPPVTDIQLLMSRMDAMQAAQTQMLQLIYTMLAQQHPPQAPAIIPPLFMPPPVAAPPAPPLPADDPPEIPAPPEDGAPPAP